MNLRTIVLAFAGVAVAAHSGADCNSDCRPKLRFAQITDVHLFDAGSNCYAPDVDIEQDAAMNGLRWAVDKINEENQAAALNFVVITGDLGIANLSDGEKPPQQRPTRNACSDKTVISDDFGPVEPERIEKAAVALACILGPLKVSSIYLLPGNNDVPYDPAAGIEDPAHRESYREFVQALSHELRGRIRDLSGIVEPGSGAPWDVIQGYKLIGLDTASFKPSDAELAHSLPVGPDPGKPASTPDPSGRGQVPLPCRDPDASSAISKARTSQVARAAALAEKASSRFLLFTHIPDLQDPFAGRQVNGAIDPSKRCSLPSSWMLVSDSKSVWTSIISNPNLVGVFAGHFHSPDESQYGGPFFAVSTVLPHDVRKIYVAPPLSLKNQWGTPNPRRGLMIVDVKDVQVKINIDWYRGIDPTEFRGKPFSSGMRLKDLIPYAIVAILLVVGFWVMLSLGESAPRRPTSPEESSTQPPPEPT